MAKLNQLIAIANGKKSHAQGELTRIYQMLQKKDLLSGISRSYTPKNDDGDRMPSETKNVQYTAVRSLSDAKVVLAELFDTVASQDNTNCVAKADVVVDGKVILMDVPVTHLLFLEKQMVDLHTLATHLPTLDPAFTWSYDSATACYRSNVQETTRTKKVMRNHVKYEATKEHPAQVETYTEDEIVGTWAKTDFSGAVPATEKNAMLGRIRQLQEALKMAREQANSVEVKNLKSSDILDFVFGS